MDFPLLVFVISLAGMWLCTRIGTSLRGRHRPEEAEREDFAVIQGAALTLLGLIIGFSFSMAVGRYDQRKNFEEEEANAIGTEYLRVGLLPQADATKVRGLLKRYVEQRFLFYSLRGGRQLDEVNAVTARLQDELWMAVQTPVAAQPSPLGAVVVTGMNDVLNTQGYTQAAWWNRIPVAAWVLMIFIACFCNVLIGLGSKQATSRLRWVLVLPTMVAISFFLIADLDSPRRGVIHVVPRNLMALAETMK